MFAVKGTGEFGHCAPLLPTPFITRPKTPLHPA
jgi:hypothetical protein